MPITLKADNKILTVTGGMAVDTLFPDTLHIDENGGHWTVGGVDFTLTFKKGGNVIDNIKLTRSDADNLPAAEDNKIRIHRSGNVLTAIGGRVYAGVLPDSITELDNGNLQMLFGEQKIIFSARDTTDTDGSIHNINLDVDGYSSAYNADAVRLVPFRNMLICDNGYFTDGQLPDKIETISDTEVHFTYGDDVFSLTWESTGNSKKNIKYTKI